MPWEPTPEQQAIIEHDLDRHARVLAGPGTGKSAAVIRMMLRAAEEIGQRGKLLTFTRAATNELREKVAEHPEHLATPSTVHSYSIATLLANEGTSGLPEPIRLADDWEWSELIRHHLKVLVDCDVRMIDRARAEMASNWESLEPAEDPDLPEEVRNRFAGGSTTEGSSAMRCWPSCRFDFSARSKTIRISASGTGSTWSLTSTRTSTSATSLSCDR